MAGAFYSSDTPEQCWTELCSAVIPNILGRDFECPEDWNRALDETGARNFTKTSVETAFWDLAAQRAARPLHEFLGGSKRHIESGLAVGLYEDVSETLRTVERYLKDGYRRVKLKIEPGRDVALIRAARKAFGNIPLFVDANGAYSLEEIDVFRRLDEFELMMYEQPLPGPALEHSAELQAAVRTPVCLDESLETPALLERAIELGSFRIANFKIQRVGGFYKALQMVDICRRHAIPAWIGTMPELGLGQAQGAALATLDAFVYPTDVEASSRWFQDDIVSPLIEVQDGLIACPTRPGLGYDVDLAKVEKYRVASRSFPE